MLKPTQDVGVWNITQVFLTAGCLGFFHSVIHCRNELRCRHFLHRRRHFKMMDGAGMLRLVQAALGAKL